MFSRVFHNSQLTQEFFAGFMGESVEPKDVFLVFTVDQGGNVVNACAALGVEVIKCNCHRVNSAVLWSLGIAGVCDDLQEQTDRRAHEEAGSMCRRLEPLRR